MTRKEELEARVEKLASRFERIGESQAKYEIVEALLQVEREVLSMVVDRIESDMEKENGSTDDQIWEIRDWLNTQQQELT